MVDAESVRVARQKLRAQGIFPTTVTESSAAARASSRDVRKYFQSTSTSVSDLAVMTRQLSTLVGAGLPLVSALQALVDQTESSALRRIVVVVREKVEEGQTLSAAISAYPKTFPGLYCNMVESGEQSGTLDTVLKNLAEYLEGQVELRRRVVSALMYPVLMLIICVLVIMGLMMFVVPKIVDIFKRQGATLPLPTRITMACSNFLIDYWPFLLLAVLGAIMWVRWYYRQPQGRSRIDWLLLKLPFFGPLYLKVGTARVAQTLGALLASGVGLLTGLDIVRNIVSNVHLKKVLEDARDGVREGRTLARELTKGGLFPTMLGHMIAIGEKSGELEGMLQKAGDAYESEVNAIIDGLSSLIEPLMLIVVGSVVLGIVLSVMLPIADLMSVVQR